MLRASEGSAPTTIRPRSPEKNSDSPALAVIDRTEDAACLRDEELAGRGQPHLVVDEADELAAERALHLADLLRDRRLPHLELLGGARQRAGMRDSPENLQLAERQVLSGRNRP